jgi:FkbM family methyltransferase
MRQIVKKIIRAWPWPVTKNERYDRLTKAILRKVLHNDSVCIDVGCYEGDILKLMQQFAPGATHFAFEPIPEKYELLNETFKGSTEIFPYALGNKNESTIFHHVVTNHTYSGLRPREYKREEEILAINVIQKKLDDVISLDTPIHFIKIDVEGGEYGVLQGAEATLAKWKPYLLFEHGLGGADRYDTKPGDVYDYLAGKLRYTICLISDYLDDPSTKGLSLKEFEDQFYQRRNYYFFAFHRL